MCIRDSYVYRHRFKNPDLEKQLEDLRKAEFYLNRLIHFAQERIYAGTKAGDRGTV